MISNPRIAVADDHPLFREGVVHILGSLGMTVVGQASTAEEAIELVSIHDPDVLLLDMKLPGGGVTALTSIVGAGGRTAVLPLSVVDSEEFVTAIMSQGARGYILKGIGGNELADAVRAVANGEIYLSPQLVTRLFGRLSAVRNPTSPATAVFTGREEQVLAFLTQGFSNKEIAYRLEISEKTVKYYLTRVLKKLHVRNRVEAALYASNRASVSTGFHTY
jgi:DNA-binding NarL/FixJ family response regulator